MNTFMLHGSARANGNTAAMAQAFAGAAGERGHIVTEETLNARREFGRGLQ